MTSGAPYEKSKSLGSGGSMVARLKLKGIDGSRGEILGFIKDELMRKHLPRMFSLIKNESWGNNSPAESTSPENGWR